jgi:hypothetical protein
MNLVEKIKDLQELYQTNLELKQQEEETRNELEKLITLADTYYGNNRRYANLMWGLCGLLVGIAVTLWLV